MRVDQPTQTAGGILSGGGNRPLATPVRPRFSCGQLLSDTDLTALVQWTADRLRLARHRLGWGVVCGLDVQWDPCAPAGVVVTPGYAISSCGDDIVVADPYQADLSGACRDDPVLCDVARPPKAPAPSGPWTVDLYLSSHAEETAPQLTMGGPGCGGGGACEATRIREGFDLTWRTVVGDEDPTSAAAERWRVGFDRCLDVAVLYRGSFADSGDYGSGRRAQIARFLRGYPARQLCAANDLVAGLPERTGVTDEAYLTRLLFQLVQDCRNRYLACACQDCDDLPGVSLARVWVDGVTDGSCRITRIDPYPPHRRPVGIECWPAPPGSVNAGRVIWQQWPGACTVLADLGVRVADVDEWSVPETVDALVTELSRSPIVACEIPVVVQVVEYEGEWRVVGLVPVPERDGQPPDAVPSSPDQSGAGPGAGPGPGPGPGPATGGSVADALIELARVGGVGSGHARTLHSAGFHGLADLGRATVDDLRPHFEPIVTSGQLASWIEEARRMVPR